MRRVVAEFPAPAAFLDHVDPRWTRVIVGLFSPMLRWYYRVEVKGLEKLEECKGAALLTANHNAGYVLDVLSLLYAVKPWTRPERKIVGLGRGGPVDAPLLKQVIRKVGGIPDSAESARTALRQGCWVLCCPGGVRGVVRPIWMRNRVFFDWQRSYVKVAQQTHCPIVPVAISGSHETVPILWSSRFLWRWIPSVRSVVPGAGRFPITLDHFLNLAVFLLLPIRHGLLAWLLFAILNLYVDAVFFWPWLPAKIRVSFGDPISVADGATPELSRAAVESAHRSVVNTLESMLADIHRRRPWPRFLV